MYHFTPDPKPKVATVLWGLPSFHGIIRAVFSVVTIAGAVSLGIWIYMARVEQTRAMLNAGPASTVGAVKTEEEAIKQRDTGSGESGVAANEYNRFNLSRFKIEPSQSPAPTTAKPTKLPSIISPKPLKKPAFLPSKTPTPTTRKPRAVATSTPKPTSTPASEATPKILTGDVSSSTYVPNLAESSAACLSSGYSGKELSVLAQKCPVYKRAGKDDLVQDILLTSSGYEITYASGLRHVRATLNKPEADETYTCVPVYGDLPDSKGGCSYYTTTRMYPNAVQLIIDGNNAKGSVKRHYSCTGEVWESCSKIADDVIVQVDAGLWLEITGTEDVSETPEIAYTLERIK
ncbi:MAG: hypothetical protein N2691_00100 [Patescibacteria group bacterium]|nr:hypothetical protein [Patescibacteria group bacterium]